MHINLKNLAQATEQQIFDQVAQHLMKQGQVCTNEAGACVYRGVGGMKCAAGALIDDDELDIRMDSQALSWLLAAERNLVPKAHAHFIRALQRLHDAADGPFEPLLRNFAREHGLVFNGSVEV